MYRIKKIILAMSVLLLCYSGSVDAAITRQNFITTIEPAVIFTFGGFSRKSSVEDILQRMEQNNMRGTFFVTERELQRNKENIDLIVAKGQEIGIGLRVNSDPDKPDDCQSLREQIQRIKALLKQYYGIETNLVKDMYGYNDDFVFEAVEKENCCLIGQTVNVVKTVDKEAVSSTEIMPNLFGKSVYSMGRGQIVYIRTDFYTNELLAGDMMLAVKKEKVDNIAYRTFDDTPESNPANDSAYYITSVGDILSKTDKLYEYPVNYMDVPQELLPENIAAPVTKENFSKEFCKRYIGSPTVDGTNRMLGFSDKDIAVADKTGIVKTAKPKTIFLTFDDWGNDDSVNKLLYVLRKHNVPATFFIITWNMPNNPNLLRAIAVSGHDIGSHTNKHRAMAAYDEKLGREVALMGKEEYAEDVAAAYKKLVDAIGDVNINGRYSLTRTFRPPTLALNKNGVQSIFDAGYSYIVSGFESTSDYASPMLPSTVGAIQNGIYDENGEVRTGSILVMHMTHAAKYTARALDIMLTENEKRTADDPLKFKVGRLSDYLINGYDQSIEIKQK